MSVKLSAFVWDGCAAAGVKGNKLLIMLRFAEIANDAGECCPSVEQLLRQTGARSPVTVRAAISELEAEGWITKQHRRNSNRSDTNFYTIDTEKLFQAAEAAGHREAYQ